MSQTICRNTCFNVFYLAWAQPGLKAASKKGKLVSNVWDWGHPRMSFLWGFDRTKPRSRKVCVQLLSWLSIVSYPLPEAQHLLALLCFSSPAFLSPQNHLFSNTLTIRIWFITYLCSGCYFPGIVLWIYLYLCLYIIISFTKTPNNHMR